MDCLREFFFECQNEIIKKKIFSVIKGENLSNDRKAIFMYDKIELYAF